MWFGIVKLWCLWLNIIGYFFSLSYMPMHDMLKKKKNTQRNQKQKIKIKMLLNMVASVFLGDVRVMECILKVIIPIKQLWLCVSVCDFFIYQNHYNMRHLCTLAMFSHTYGNFLLLLIHVHVQCDLAIARNTCVNVCSLNCHNLLLKYKIG